MLKDGLRQCFDACPRANVLALSIVQHVFSIAHKGLLKKNKPALSRQGKSVKGLTTCLFLSLTLDRKTSILQAWLDKV